MSENKYRFATKTIHSGQVVDPVTKSRALPLYQTSSYVFDDVEQANNMFSLKEEGHIYSRMSNPTVRVFEDRMADLEGGVGAVATSSGQAAIVIAILTVAKAGDEVISAAQIYGGTYSLFATTLSDYGITVKFVDATDPVKIEAAITSKTKAIFAESIGNPSLHVLDTKAFAEIANTYGIPFIIDNTFATPYLFKPIEHGAHIVVHSATKWIGGHGTSIGGVIIDSGTFNWNNERFPSFLEEQPSYHGKSFALGFGKKGFLVKAREKLLRDIGSSLSPFNAFLFLQGLETLHVRMQRHIENAEDIAQFLSNHEQVSWVSYPSLESHPSHETAKRTFTNGYGAVVVFGVNGGRDAAIAVINRVKLWSHLANVGDSKSLIIHPASTTHQQLQGEALKETGVTEEMIRLSVGIEDIEDLKVDLENALTGKEVSIDGEK